MHFRTILVNISHMIPVVTLYQQFLKHQALFLDWSEFYKIHSLKPKCAGIATKDGESIWSLRL